MICSSPTLQSSLGLWMAVSSYILVSMYVAHWLLMRGRRLCRHYAGLVLQPCLISFLIMCTYMQVVVQLVPEQQVVHMVMRPPGPTTVFVTHAAYAAVVVRAKSVARMYFFILFLLYF